MDTLFLGLGNIGDKYRDSRHNVGFKVVDRIAASNSGVVFSKMSSDVDVALFPLEDRKILIAKPRTFMNLSGRAARHILAFYKIPLERVYVFHDDINLNFGLVRVKKGGGSGGHNGLRSIDSLVGKDYWRVRIGIGRPEEKSMVASYVLEDFLSDEAEILENICLKISKNIKLLIDDGEQFGLELNNVHKI